MRSIRIRVLAIAIVLAVFGDAAGSAQAGPRAQMLNTPGQMAVGADGYLYVIDRGHGRIVKFDVAGTFVKAWGGMHPKAIAADDKGHVYVATVHPAIKKYDSDGHLLTEWNGGLGSAEALATDRAGDVYVSDNTRGAIFKFTPSGDRMAEYPFKYGCDAFGCNHLRSPSGLALDREGHLYIADPENRMVQKRSPTGGVLGDWHLNGHPSAVATDPHGDVYVVSNHFRGAHKFHGNGERVKSWHGPAGDAVATLPGGVAVWNRTVYLSSIYDHRIKQLTGDGLFVKDIGVDPYGPLDHPAGVDVDESGRVLVTDTRHNRMLRFNPAGEVTHTFGWGYVSDPQGVTTHPNGLIYVADQGQNEVEVFGAGGNYAGVWDLPQSIQPSRGWVADTAVDPTDGSVYVALSHRVAKFAPDGRLLLATFSDPRPSASFMIPRGVAVDSGGNVYIADHRNDRILKFASDGKFIKQWKNVQKPTGLAVDEAGHVYVVDIHSRIVKFSPDGELLEAWHHPFSDPQGIAVTGNRHIYVADAGHDRIAEFNAYGHFVREFR